VIHPDKFDGSANCSKAIAALPMLARETTLAALDALLSFPISAA